MWKSSYEGEAVKISLVAVAKNKDAQMRMDSIRDAGIQYLSDMGFNTSGMLTGSRGMATFALDAAANEWKPPLYRETTSGEFIGVTSVPIPVDHKIATVEDYWTFIEKKFLHDDFGSLLSNYFGFKLDEMGNGSIWHDRLGIGRAFKLENSDYFVVSNHIGLMAHFSNEQLTLDDSAIAKFCGTGFYMGTSTPYEQIKFLVPAAKIDFDIHGNIRQAQYDTVANLFCRREESPDFDAVAKEFEVACHNIGELSQTVLSIGLSGGKDSRLVAGAWLASGQPAKLYTINTVQGEIDVAQDLMNIYYSNHKDSNVEYEIREVNPSTVTMPLSERIKNSFLIWDGVSAPNPMNGNIRVTSLRPPVTLSGVIGEFMHGVYYMREAQRENWKGLRETFWSRTRVLLGTGNLSEFSTEIARQYSDELEEAIASLDWDNVAALDAFYALEKGRRWPPQSLRSNDPILFSAPAFVRACFDMSPEEKVNNKMLDEVLSRTVPEWVAKPTYKAQGEDSRKQAENRSAAHDTDWSGYWDALDQSDAWKKYFDVERLSKFRKFIEEDEHKPVHTAILNKAMWVNSIESHVQRINAKIVGL